MTPTRWQRFKDSSVLHSFVHDKVAMLSFAVMVVYLVASFSAPVVAPHNPYDPTQIDIMDSEIPPIWIEGGDPRFIFGTDAQ